MKNIEENQKIYDLLDESINTVKMELELLKDINDTTFDMVSLTLFLIYAVKYNTLGEIKKELETI